MSVELSNVVSAAVHEHYGLKGEYTALPSEWGGTFRLSTDHGRQYLVKCTPLQIPVDRIELEQALLRHLQGQSLPFETPALTETVTGKHLVSIDPGNLRVMHWVTGRVWHDVNPHTTTLASSLGTALGQLKKALHSFSHQAAQFALPWAPHEAEWVGRELDLFGVEDGKLVVHFLDLLARHLPLIDTLRRGVNYNDANDHNIIVSTDAEHPQVTGFIDFGDVQHGPEINDLAICLAYAMQRCPDPLEIARHVVRAFHREYPIREAELKALFPVIAARLVISVTFSALRRREDPANAYWQVSDQQSWDLLRQLDSIPEQLAHSVFREACELEPSPRSAHVRQWLTTHQDIIYPVLGRNIDPDEVEVFDWSVGSSAVHPDNRESIESQCEDLFADLRRQGLFAGIGRYNEPRIVYSADHYTKTGLNGPERRTIHLGIDIFTPAGTPLYAPLDGTVIANCADAGQKGYGHLLILQHEADEDVFYTLYGHNSRRTLQWLESGDEVRKGTRIAEVGTPEENGGWIPHLHFQVITDLLGYNSDFPGVAYPAQRRVWKSLCPDPNLILQIDHPGMTLEDTDSAKLAARRRSVLGPNLSLSYGQPLHIVRGWRSGLYRADGVRYLDTCNNIAHVGHEHPEVVRAAQRQLSVLNTNTRYLHAGVVKLAEEILETLPPSLGHIYFVNSGSEANDLALRIARTYCGRQQTVVLDHAYHGVTRASLEISPYKFKGAGGFDRPDHVTVLPLPDTYRTYPEDPAGCLRDAQETLRGLKGDPLTFIHETLPSCAGQVVPPRDYFRSVYAQVQADGGVCIADEVQTGVGRVGSHYWAFQLYGVEPDIVTIGKPLGNGHPVAAVAVTSKLVQAFDTGMEFFSSFGGNPVSSITALTVMQVVRREHLQEHALSTGTYWKSALGEIRTKCAYIGDVRGFGLFLGIEFSQPGTRQPASAQARYLQRRLLDHKILTSLDGPDHNVIKIKPPMCITRDEVDYFLETFWKVCGEDAMRS